MSLVVRRQPNETWREAVIRYAAPYGLATECLELFDDDPQREADPARAAFDALYEWDCVDFEP